MDINSSFFYARLKEYKSTESFDTSRIKSDLIKEVSTKSDYKGREIYELLQNAEDEKSEFVNIRIDKSMHILSISNGGNGCIPFSEKGFCSIMMADNSPKLESKQPFIGCKGLGFRSLLNWAKRISIHSDGVCCSFSREIAKKYWEDIKEDLGKTVAQQHEKFAKEQYGYDSPVCFLAIPKVCEDNCNEEKYTTKIEIEYIEECEASIIDQINNLTGKVLLFLSHIERIEIEIDGVKRQISKEKGKDEDKIKIKDEKNTEGSDFILYTESGEYEKKKYEVSIAYNPDTKECGEYLYTFFPTKVRLGLPCVIHATFDLNSSRNSLNESETNDWMQKKIAECLMAFAERLAEKMMALSWDYLELISLNQYDQKEFDILHKTIEEKKANLKIYPTVGGEFKKQTDTVRYSQEMARYSYVANLFAHHLAEGYNNNGIEDQPAGDDFVDIVNKIATEFNNAESRADLIFVVSSVKRSGKKKFRILIDNDEGIITEQETAYIFTGDIIEHLPEDIGIRYINEDLVKSLISTFKVEDSYPKRALARLLREKCGLNVSAMDLSNTKERIIDYTNRMNREGFVQLMYALFQHIRNSKDPSSLKEAFHNDNFKVMASDGNLHFPAEVVIADDDLLLDSQKLLHTTDEWVKILTPKNEAGETITKDDVIEFFTKTMGVSYSVPMHRIKIDDKAHDYLHSFAKSLEVVKGDSYYYSSNINQPKSEDHYNEFNYIEEELINQLQKGDRSLIDIIELIMSDSHAMTELRNNTLSYKFRTLKHESVEVSYPLYLLRKYDLFKPLSSFVVSDNILLDGDSDLESKLSEFAKTPENKQMLLLLGARFSVSDLTLNELYTILKELPERELKKGVQKLYKTIREAIMSKMSDASFKELATDFRDNGKAYARKDGGELEIKPVTEIYYWDNEQLPHNILSSKYKLEMPNRVGEESVREIFGVKLAKDIEITIQSSTDNPTLSDEIKQRISKRIRYILAYRLQTGNRRITDPKERKSIAETIRGIEIKIYSQCSLDIDSEQVVLAEGDMVSTKNGAKQVFHICTRCTDIESAIKTPSFCENVTEALCISLKISSNEIANSFRSILKNSIPENDFISKKEIATDIWDEVDKALGLSEDEKRFWEEVACNTSQKIDFEEFSSSYTHKRDYLLSLFTDLCLPDNYTDVSEMDDESKYNLLRSLQGYGLKDAKLLGEPGLKDYYRSYIKKQITLCKGSFERHAYEYANNPAVAALPTVPPVWFYETTTEFSSGNWIEQSLDDNKHEILSPGKLEDLFNDAAQKKYNTFIKSLDTRVWTITIRSKYQSLMDQYNVLPSNLDQKDLSYAYFEGFEKEFEEKLNGITTNLTADSNKLEPQFEIDSLSFSFGLGENKQKKEGSANSSSKPRGGYSTDRAKHKAGLLAEQKVYQYLSHHTEMFADVRGCSRNLDPNGDDSLHYDIMYSIIENGIKGHVRYLEVKSMSDDTIIMSKNEYDFAHKNASYYDFAIVKDNTITIIKSPFSTDEGSSGLQAVPESYSISLSIKKDSTPAAHPDTP